MLLIRIFRICAITEAVTWVGLLYSMYEKYIADTHTELLHIMGSLHGYACLAYVLVVFLVRAEYGWSNRMTLAGARSRRCRRSRPCPSSAGPTSAWCGRAASHTPPPPQSVV